jgi:hypothetical protein
VGFGLMSLYAMRRRRPRHHGNWSK